MALYVLNPEKLPGWNNNLHFVTVCKKRKNGFNTPEKLQRVKEAFLEKASKLGITVHAITVAYNHVHFLVNSNGKNHSDIAKELNGYTAFILRKEFEDLKTVVHQKSLWGGKSCRAIEDEEHFNNALRYINSHQPDNTKIPDEWKFDPNDE